MTKGKSEHERISELEATLPILSVGLEDLRVEVEDLSRKLGSLDKFAPIGPQLSVLPVGLLHSPFLFGLPELLASLSSYESTASQFGELKAEAEDMVDDLEDDVFENLDEYIMAKVSDATGREGRASQLRGRAEVEKVAQRVREALSKGRAARRKAKGAAAAAKQLAAANPKLTEARTSFKEASKKIREYDKKKAEANTQQRLKDLGGMLKEAKTKIDTDLGHLNDAMELVV